MMLSLSVDTQFTAKRENIDLTGQVNGLKREVGQLKGEKAALQREIDRLRAQVILTSVFSI